MQAPPPQDVPRGTAGADGDAVPTFAIVVAAYQAADVIGDALASAVAQTLPAREIVVCDDGSSDGLDDALEPYTDRVTVVRQANAGEAAAKNRAVAATSAEFFVILDADDVFEPDRLAALAALGAARPDLDILTTDAVLEVDGEPVRRCYTDEHRFVIGDQRAALLERNFVFGLAAVRRAAFDAVGGFDESIRRTTDWDCWIRMVHSGSRVGLVDAPLARYRVRERSLSADRGAMVDGALRTLTKAARMPGLRPHERDAVANAIAWRRAHLEFLRARDALRSGESDGRARAWAVARDGRQGRDVRARAALAALAPSLARRRLVRDARETWTGAGGVRVSRRP